LHEGSGSAAINAFVEVVFDNSDNRFSLENSDEVVLRRTVGAKKDEFFLQRKLARKQEVQSLLEGAGFSKSNPYFMVQQGKIQTLCVMTDTQRLQLLQQVAGTTVYEQKKAESVAKMQENEQSINKIDEILSEINQRLDELQGEKEELTVYQQADRQRKAIEYTLYDKELRKSRHALDHLETERMEHVEELTRLHEQSKATHDAIQQSEGQLHVKSQALKRNRNVLKDLEGDKTQTVRRKTQLALQCQELEEQIETSRETMQRAQSELVAVEQGIAQAKTQLAQVEQQWTTETQTLRDMKQNVELSQRELDGLYARQSRGSQFATKAERDASLHRQIADLTSVLQDKQQQLQGRRDALGNARRTIVTQAQDVETQQAILTKKQESMQSLAKALDERKRTRLLVLEQRKQTWRSAEQLEEQVREARSAWHETQAATRKCMPRATSLGIGALERVVREERLVVGEQYFGMVLENMTLKDPKYQTAVEIAAQNALFHVVVDTDATAARLMKRLEDGKLGRVTFLPLTKLRTSSNETMFPRDTQDVTNLLETCINYPPAVRKAMQHVFDRKLLARSSDAALEWSTRMQMDAITLEGDLCSRKGALSGGYMDPSQSRLKAFAQQQAAKERYAQVESEYKALDQQATQSEQEATNLGQAVQHLQHKQSELTNAVRSLEQAIEQAKSQVQHSTSQATKLESLQIPPLQEEVMAIEAEVARLRDELGTELTVSFSEEDRTQLNRLKQTIATVRQDIQVQTDQFDQVSMEREKLKSLLKDNLLKRKKELLQAGRGSKEDDDEDDSDPGDRPVPATAATTAQWLEVQTQELQALQEQRNEVEGTLEELEERLDNARQLEENTKADLLAAKNELESLRNEDLKTRKELDAANETEEKLMGKVSFDSLRRFAPWPLGFFRLPCFLFVVARKTGYRFAGFLPFSSYLICSQFYSC
jgi:structural maintenance of chromosome 3 (chondroitin sulfate proteoglycan 6)